MLQLHGTKGQISREGVQTVWAQFYSDGYEGIDTVPGTFNGVSGGRVDLVEKGTQYVVTAKYEGIASASMVRPIYEWQAEETQEPIKTNPNWTTLKDKYKGKWDNDAQDIEWEEQLELGKKGKTVDNPMAGVQSWLDVGGSWTETTVVEQIDPEVWSGMWSLVEEVPGNLPTPSGRLWLVLPPQIRQRDACFEIRKCWKLTGVMTPERLEASRLIYTPFR